ncbi:hypothetical protein B0H19DRAFT_1077922 [Mycena capillaripes]|nr:hypothetical protein B0H19DRAFT_1077922 [Mycena capillaripes]
MDLSKTRLPRDQANFTGTDAVLLWRPAWNYPIFASFAGSASVLNKPCAGLQVTHVKTIIRRAPALGLISPGTSFLTDEPHVDEMAGRCKFGVPYSISAHYPWRLHTRLNLVCIAHLRTESTTIYDHTGGYSTVSLVRRKKLGTRPPHDIGRYDQDCAQNGVYEHVLKGGNFRLWHMSVKQVMANVTKKAHAKRQTHSLDGLKRRRLGGERGVASEGGEAKLRNVGSHGVDPDQSSRNFRPKHHFALKFGMGGPQRPYLVP